MKDRFLLLTTMLVVLVACVSGFAQEGDVAAEPAGMQSIELPLLGPGFLTGMTGFDEFVHPVSSPLYFHDPFIDTRVNVIYLWNKFPKGSDLKGGDLSVWALPFWVALSEKLQLTAEIDGYSRIRARALRPDEGWNDLALGLKYNLIADEDAKFALSTGLSWRLSNGHALTLNGGTDELNPYVTAAKKIGKWQMIGTFGARLPMNHHRGNYILHENLHVAYELVENFFPLVEVNALQYLTNSDRLPLSVGGLDYANIGSNNVSGNSTFWAGLGFRWKVHENVEVGATYEFPLSNRSNDILDQRVTISVILGL